QQQPPHHTRDVGVPLYIEVVDEVADGEVLRPQERLLCPSWPQSPHLYDLLVEPLCIGEVGSGV
ncbi:13628_t:CDS:2, partial [Racocetra persica]